MTDYLEYMNVPDAWYDRPLIRIVDDTVCMDSGTKNALVMVMDGWSDMDSLYRLIKDIPTCESVAGIEDQYIAPEYQEDVLEFEPAGPADIIDNRSPEEEIQAIFSSPDDEVDTIVPSRTRESPDTASVWRSIRGSLGNLRPPPTPPQVRARREFAIRARHDPRFRRRRRGNTDGD